MIRPISPINVNSTKRYNRLQNEPAKIDNNFQITFGMPILTDVKAKSEAFTFYEKIKNPKLSASEVLKELQSSDFYSLLSTQFETPKGKKTYLLNAIASEGKNKKGLLGRDDLLSLTVDWIYKENGIFAGQVLTQCDSDGLNPAVLALRGKNTRAFNKMAGNLISLKDKSYFSKMCASDESKITPAIAAVETNNNDALELMINELLNNRDYNALASMLTRADEKNGNPAIYAVWKNNKKALNLMIKGLEQANKPEALRKMITQSGYGDNLVTAAMPSYNNDAIKLVTSALIRNNQFEALENLFTDSPGRVKNAAIISLIHKNDEIFAFIMDTLEEHDPKALCKLVSQDNYNLVDEVNKYSNDKVKEKFREKIVFYCTGTNYTTAVQANELLCKIKDTSLYNDKLGMIRLEIQKTLNKEVL